MLIQTSPFTSPEAIPSLLAGWMSPGEVNGDVWINIFHRMKITNEWAWHHHEEIQQRCLQIASLLSMCPDPIDAKSFGSFILKASNSITGRFQEYQELLKKDLITLDDCRIRKDITLPHVPSRFSKRIEHHLEKMQVRRSELLDLKLAEYTKKVNEMSVENFQQSELAVQFLGATFPFEDSEIFNLKNYEPLVQSKEALKLRVARFLERRIVGIFQVEIKLKNRGNSS
eukprot:TRINITY_DN6627_c0_g4_i1.p1 TRINITY_DN6627_c0_g4~~TRINITY_DN6627_c0_g4_i1.p1  ORF type:complete len:228 (-),score=83.94 TRINITY_DN6627_c0_g4_i1:799-1482(-)